MDQLQTAVWIYDIDQFRIVWANQPALELWNSPSVQELCARNFKDESSEAVKNRLIQYQKGFQSGHTYQEKWALTPKGQEKTALCQFSGYKLEGRMAMLVEALPDIDTSVAMPQSAAMLLSSFSADGAFISANPPFQKAFNTQALNLEKLFVSAADMQHFINDLKAQKQLEQDIKLRTLQGERWYRIKAEHVEQGSGSPFFLLNLYDIHERKIVEITLHKQAHTDSLTGLYNRRGLRHCLSQKILQQSPFTLLYLDLDGFKIINDSFGHNAGDIVLKEVANRLNALKTENSILCRFGGDEFICVIGGVMNTNQKHQLCTEIIDAVSMPFDGLQISSLQVSASIGLVQYPEQNRDLEHLIMCADAAMYKAKSLGKKGWADYTEGMENDNQRISKIAQFLTGAIQQNELSLHYQPIVNLDNQSIVGFEALLRWHNPTLGYVNPQEAIHVAEQIGLIQEIEHWVMNCALQDLKQLKSALKQPLSMSINVSAIHFSLPHFCENLLDLIAHHSLAPTEVTVELTENMLVQNLATECDTLTKLVNQGVTVSIDDFGTGYSSLAYLHDIPATIVKVDRSFVARSASSTLRFIQQLADSLSINTLVEGIETQEKADLLHSFGFRLQQGYFHGRPQPLHYYLNSSGKNKNL